MHRAFGVVMDSIPTPIPTLNSLLTPASPPAPGLFVDSVRLEVERELAFGNPNVASIARKLGTSSRTLQRRLGETGLSFRDVVEEVREQLARAYLTDVALPMGEVAQRLGYAEVSAFLRAFKRWTGMTPGQLRAAAA
jgi:AraC-like DNA-binding protein